MLFDSTFRNYLAQRPAAVMTRATLEHIFAAEAIDELFDRTARRQYTQELTFSTVVALLEAVVLTTSLRCEVDTLGYPKAALLGFALAVCVCNALSVVCVALADAQARTQADTKAAAAKQPWEASSYAPAVELRAAYDGVVVNVPNAVWGVFGSWSAGALADWPAGVARSADRKRYRKSKRGPKKPVKRVQAGPRAAHRSTARLLAQRTKPPKPTPRP